MLKSQYQVATVNNNAPIIEGPDQTAVTFAANSTISSKIHCAGTPPAGMIFPSSWQNSEISFLVSKTPNDADFVPFTNFDGSALNIAIDDGVRCLPLQAAMFHGILYLKLVSSVAQPAMTIEFLLTPIYQGIHA